MVAPPLNVGRSVSAFGHEIGSLPLKFASPNSSCPSALPPTMPGYQAITTAGAIDSQGMSMTLPPSMTTTNGLPRAATDVTRLFCMPLLILPFSAKVVRSPLPLYSSPSS